ncbi:VOC family protein [Streptomyces pathocidini]|uniref:VOC family protein n=1 Tax=Streptomyces pathocidini TaxID=1650571 RepID=A0ABW7UP23_9ACTN|nr:VOC family protein [Streptomyces pathocidini]
MPTQIFVNLPVKDLPKAKEFFTEVGFSFDPRFEDANAACMIIDADKYVMLLVEPFFKTFVKNEIADTSTHTESILALGVDSRERVDELFARAIAAGGRHSRETDDESPMYGRSFLDLDGHLWEVFHLDPAAVQ